MRYVALWQVRVGDRWKFAEPEIAAMVAVNHPGHARLADVPETITLKPERFPRYQPAGITPRRLAAARKALRTEVEKAGLFGAMVQAEQPTPEQRVQAFTEGTIELDREMRARRARDWREARWMLRALPVGDRVRIVCKFNDQFGPRDGARLKELIRRLDPPATVPLTINGQQRTATDSSGKAAGASA